MRIRLLKPADISKAAKIVGQNYSKQFQQNSVKEMKAMFKGYIFKPQYIVAEEKGEIIGLSGFCQSWADYDIYEIFWVNVKPNHQKKGIGTKLVAKTIELIKKKKARVILITTTKPRFYSKKFKFKTVDIWHKTRYVMILKI